MAPQTVQTMRGPNRHRHVVGIGAHIQHGRVIAEPAAAMDGEGCSVMSVVPVSVIPMIGSMVIVWMAIIVGATAVIVIVGAASVIVRVRAITVIWS